MEWKISTDPVDYEAAIAAMESRVDGIIDGTADEQVWLLEHPPLYTAGTSAKPSDILDAERFPIYATGRGGQHTYHGPGQRIAYTMLDLKRRAGDKEPDLRQYVQQLEHWLIATLAEFGVESFTREGRVGVWTLDKGRECKIAALGIRVRKWVTYHGIALNHSPDLAHYAGIVPCGISEYGVTSLKALGINASMHELDDALRNNFEKIFSI